MAGAVSAVLDGEDTLDRHLQELRSNGVPPNATWLRTASRRFRSVVPNAPMASAWQTEPRRATSPQQPSTQKARPLRSLSCHGLLTVLHRPFGDAAFGSIVDIPGVSECGMPRHRECSRAGEQETKATDVQELSGDLSGPGRRRGYPARSHCAGSLGLGHVGIIPLGSRRGDA